VYGSARAEESNEEVVAKSGAPEPRAPLLGDILTLIASVLYGLYQVLYKKYAAFSPVTADLYQAIPDEAGNSAPVAAAAYPPPFGLFPNFLTGTVGLYTIIVLGGFVPILHILGIESFRLPDLRTAGAIAIIALSGMVFNAGYMVSLVGADAACQAADAHPDLAWRLGPRGHLGRGADHDRPHVHLRRDVRGRTPDRYSLELSWLCSDCCVVRHPHA
jgi:hypothetical protein